MITPPRIPINVRYIFPLLIFAANFSLFFSESWGADLKDELKISSLVRCFSKPDKPAPSFEDGKFAPKAGETISFIGGTNTFDLQKYPFLEILLQIAYPDLDLKIRNLAWHGDTVLYQARPAFYFTKAADKQPGSVADQRDRVQPGTVFVNFGKMESLNGPDSLEEFLSAYKILLDQLQTRTQRIVLISPTPFSPVGPAKNLAKARNVNLAKFEIAIRKEAKERKFLYVDQFNPVLKSPSSTLTFDGIHLTQSGHILTSIMTAGQLDFPLDSAAALKSTELLSTLRQSILRKDFLWQQYYHPTNWAFLYGDRQSQPASRSHLDKNKRWFRNEVDQLPSLINETETDIHRYAAEFATKIRK